MKRKTRIHAHGVQCLLSSHPEVRKLKRKHYPEFHGNKVWKTSWLLIDYLKQTNAIGPGNILDVGCGWGLSGIFLTKHCSARVTGIDIDPNIRPYLDLHLKINQVRMEFFNRDYKTIREPELNGVSGIIGADICFWSHMVGPLKRLINRARRFSVKTIVLADPGREPFHELSSYYQKSGDAEVVEWTIDEPCSFSGMIMKIDV